jgi:hypothetical protein
MQRRIDMGKVFLNENESILFEFKFYIKFHADNYDKHENNYYKCLSSPIIYNKYNEGDTEYEENIGYIEIWHVDGTRAFDNDLDIVDICDSIERELYEYLLAIYKDGYIDKKLVEMPRSNDILILHRIEINKKYQGRNFGIIISKKMIDYLGYNCGAILIRPCPIQFSDISKKDNWMNNYYSERFSIEKDESIKKLKKYWGKIAPCIKVSNRKDIIYIPQD